MVREEYYVEIVENALMCFIYKHSDAIKAWLWVRLSLISQFNWLKGLRSRIGSPRLRCAQSNESQIKLSLVKISFDFDDWISASCCSSEWKSLIGWHNLSWKNWKIINDTEHFNWIKTEFNRKAWFRWILNDGITIYES